MALVRAELKTGNFKKTKKGVTFCEGTLEEAKAYTQAMIDNGVIVVEASYYDNDRRISDIYNGIDETPKL